MAKQPKFDITGTVLNHNGKWVGKMTLRTPDGTETSMHSQPFDTRSEAEADLKKSLEEILADFNKNHGIMATHRRELRTIDPGFLDKAMVCTD